MKKQKLGENVALNVEIPKRVRAAAKAAAAFKGVTLAAAVSEALQNWALENTPGAT